MAITSIPTQVTPPLWAYTFVQAPINGNGYDYFNTAVKRRNYGSVGTGSLAIDVTSAAIHRWQPTANTTLTFTGFPAVSTGYFWQVEIRGGSLFTINWPAAIRWDSSVSAPTLSANVTLLNFFTPNQGTTIYGGVAFADINAA